MSKNDSVNWEELIKGYRSSGLTLAKWCTENNVSRHAMHYHMYKKVQASSDSADSVPKLLEVNFNESIISPSAVIRLGQLEIAVDQQNIDIVSQLIKKIIYD